MSFDVNQNYVMFYVHRYDGKLSTLINSKIAGTIAIIRVTSLLSISTFNFIQPRAVGYRGEPFDKNVMNFVRVISYVIINFKLVTRKRNKNRKEKSNAMTRKRSMMY